MRRHLVGGAALPRSRPKPTRPDPTQPNPSCALTEHVAQKDPTFPYPTSHTTPLTRLNTACTPRYRSGSAYSVPWVAEGAVACDAAGVVCGGDPCDAVRATSPKSRDRPTTLTEGPVQTLM